MARSIGDTILKGETASRILSTDSNRKITSVEDLTAWILGGASILSTNNGNGTVTITVIPGGIDHGSLANLLSGNPHTQYVLKTGDTMTGELIIDPSSGDDALDCQKNITLKSGQKSIFDGA